MGDHRKTLVVASAVLLISAAESAVLALWWSGISRDDTSSYGVSVVLGLLGLAAVVVPALVAGEALVRRRRRPRPALLEAYAALGLHALVLALAAVVFLA